MRVVQRPVGQAAARLRVFLDCGFCFEDYIVDEVDVVEYVRDPAEADIQIIVTESDTAGGGTERTVSFVGLGRFKGIDHSIRALTDSSDTEDTERSRLATAMTIGLLHYMSRAASPVISPSMRLIASSCRSWRPDWIHGRAGRLPWEATFRSTARKPSAR